MPGDKGSYFAVFGEEQEPEAVVASQPTVVEAPAQASQPAQQEKLVPRTAESQGFTQGRNVIDVAELGGWGNAWNRRRLRERGFSYQDATTGDIVSVDANSLSRGDMRRLVRNAAREERLARRFGIGDTTGWSQDAIALRRQQVGNDFRYTTINPAEQQAAEQQATNPGRTWNYNLANDGWSGDNAFYGKTAEGLLKALYENKQYDILDALSDGNGNITYDSMKNYQAGLGTGDEFKSGNFGENSLKAMLDKQYITQEQYNRLFNGLGTPTAPQNNIAGSIDLSSFTDDQLADQVIAGRFGAGTDRAAALGSRFNAVQAIVNQKLGRTASTGTSSTSNGASTSATTSSTGTTSNASSTAEDATAELIRALKIAGQKHGGKITQMKYFQQGGSVAAQQVAQEQAQEQQAQLNEMFMALAKNPKETLLALQKQGVQPKQVIELAQKMADKNPAAKEALAAISQMSQMAKQGAKLTYIKRLRGECPEGYEPKLYRAGGKVCTKCEKIQADKCGGKAKKHENGGEAELVTEFKNRKKK